MLLLMRSTLQMFSSLAFAEMARRWNMEQSANPIARLRTITRTIQTVTKDTSLQAYIWLLTAAAPSDSVFRALGTN